ncbi:MAG TPA: hypothetical protein VK712_01910 [Verrucomicrobiae bacterium]|jgi:hypothetical protein|nr:hypothetical protein [Verrucomicrobiae bacterium]
MSELLNIKHANFSMEEVSLLISAETMPVRRGVHVGNQKPHDLAVECCLPPGVDVLAADTINGNDRVSRPRYIKLFGGEITLAAEKYRSKIVCAIPLKENIQEELNEHRIPIMPRADETIADLHLRAILELNPNNPPIRVSKFFTRHRTLYQATVEATAKEFQGSRIVNETECSPQEVGIFGLEDASPKTSGLVPSINVMMAMDILTAAQQGFNASLHLGGSGMAEYTREPKRMASLSKVIGRVASEIGFKLRSHTYLISNINGFSEGLDPAVYTSQYELLRSRAAPERV